MEQFEWYRKQFKANFQSWYIQKKIQDVVDDRLINSDKISKFLEEKAKEHSRQLALETDSGLSAIEQHTKKTLAKYMKDEEFVDIMKFQFTDVKQDLTKHFNAKIKKTNKRIEALEEWRVSTNDKTATAFVLGVSFLGSSLYLYNYYMMRRW